jgi:hypothetical protein
MKTVKILNKLVCLILACGLSAPVSATKTMSLDLPTPDPLGQQLYNNHQWSLLYYYGQTVNGAMVGTIVGNFKHWPEHIQSLELAYTLDENNSFRRFFSPLVGVVQLASNITVRNGDNEPTIYEFDPYIMWRWSNFPWNHKITTSLALAEGVSYVTHTPYIEKRGNNGNYKHLLNYLMFEATFARPSYPQLQFVIRVHHRSGAYGLYGAGNNGSNDIGAGIRYLF